MTDDGAIAEADLVRAGPIYLAASARDALQAVGLARAEDFLTAVETAQAVTHGDDLRLIRRVERGSGDDRLVAYLKWYAPGPWHRRAARWLRGRRASGAELELRRICRLRQAGIDVPEPLAFGEGLALGRFRSFLLLSSMEHWPTLEEIAHSQRFQRQLACMETRRRLIDAVARLARQTHQAGIANPSLYSRHVLIESLDADPIRVGLIDLEDLDLDVRVDDRRRTEDLGALALTLQREFVSRSDRVRFIRQYYQAERIDSVARRLIARIEAFYQQNRDRQRFRHYSR